MKSVVIFDSLYGNTRKIALAVAQNLLGQPTAIHVCDATPASLAKFDFIVIGCPTHAGWPSEPCKKFLGSLPAGCLDGKRFAAFDTRMPNKDSNFFIRTVINLFGFAGPRLAKALEAKGGKRVGEPAGFVVKAKEGPLEDGEVERAKEWAKQLGGQ
ncbi:MAG: flavodoxin family protein [Candidatus Micrarchaeota archaeon]